MNEFWRYGGKTCYSKSLDMCDFHRDCIDGDDENNHICGELDHIYQRHHWSTIFDLTQMSWPVLVTSTCATSPMIAATGQPAWGEWDGSRLRTLTTRTCSSWGSTCLSTSAMTLSPSGSWGILLTLQKDPSLDWVALVQVFKFISLQVPRNASASLL